eukprot:GHVH01009977.1.p1 GENE.GHVH01009977.1~~GHVH01009977.1.p1  ORF type:complete len:159 (+),score=41.29 GHVH01009977.1:3-479(+)
MARSIRQREEEGREVAQIDPMARSIRQREEEGREVAQIDPMARSIRQREEEGRIEMAQQKIFESIRSDDLAEDMLEVEELRTAGPRVQVEGDTWARSGGVERHVDERPSETENLLPRKAGNGRPDMKAQDEMTKIRVDNRTEKMKEKSRMWMQVAKEK